MDIRETLDCMNSDFKLWEKAESKDLGGGVVEKTITLPWGIGEVVVNLEGMNDAGKRRAAVGSYGEYIRGVIDEQTNDEAVTSRAKAALARSELANSEDSTGVNRELGVRDEEVQEASDEEASEAYEEDVSQPLGLGEVFANRRAEIIARIDRTEHRRAEANRTLDQLSKELNAIDAALEALGDDNE
jgi:hypothetical protein